MRILAAVALVSVSVSVLSATAAERDVRSVLDQVTVYPDGATVTRIIQADVAAGDNTLIARDFPPGLDPASLRVEGEGRTRLVIGAIDARPPRAERPPTNPDLESRIEALKDERGRLDDKIAAAMARRKFAVRFSETSPAGIGEKGEARPLAEWRAAFAAIAEEVAAADSLMREAKLRQREIDRDLAKLEAARVANPPRKMEVRIDLAADAATPATLRVSYTVRGARWSPLYDARLDTGTRERKPALELIRRAEIVQQSGEDWNDVALTVSTVRTAKGGGAPELRPLIVRYQQPPRPMPRAEGALNSQFAGIPVVGEMLAAQRADERTIAPGLVREKAAMEREAFLDAGGYQVVYRVPGRISVATNEGAKSFRIATATIAPTLVVRATPAIDETGYLEATFKHAEEAPLLPGRVSVYRDGMFVGRSQIALTPKDENLRLGFGADDKVKITRAVVKKIEGSAGLISSSKTDEREFKITVRNGHATPIAVAIEDQVPVSEIADVQVQLLPITTPPSERDVKDRRGVLVWTFEAAPGEQRDIRLGWRLRWPSDKAIVVGARGS
jgi:uncharacterized protein (TIGR02231 family)